MAKEHNFSYFGEKNPGKNSMTKNHRKKYPKTSIRWLILVTLFLKVIQKKLLKALEELEERVC
jgi:hypothetical protein